MVKAGWRDDGPSVNLITRSGFFSGGNEEKVVAEPLIRKASDKKEGLNLQKEKEIFIKSRKDFADAGASMSRNLMEPKVDDEVKPFLQAFIKLLCNQKVVENL